MELVEPGEHVGGEPVHLFVEVGDLQFGLQIHVVLDVGTDPVLGRLTILAEQDEDREKDGLERNGEREEAVGEGIELRDAGDVNRY